MSKLRDKDLIDHINAEFAYDGGKGEDLIYAADLPEIIALVREHDGENAGTTRG